MTDDRNGSQPPNRRPDAVPGSVKERPRVVVVGAGFGGLQVIRALAGNDAVDVLALDRNNYHGFWPLLYQVATAALAPDTVAYPVRQITARSRNVTFQMVEAHRVDLAHRRVHTDSGEIPYDYLVLAAGSANNYFGNTSIPQHTLSLKDVDQAVVIRQHLLEVLEQAAREPGTERRRVLLTFAIVGAGPTGVELAGAFADLLGPLLREEYPELDPSEARIVLVEAHDTMLDAFPKPLQETAARHLRRMGVVTRQNAKVTDVAHGVVTFDGGGTMEAGTVVWAAGVKAAPIAETLGQKLAHADRVPVQRTLNLRDHPEVFVIGDLAYLEGYRGGRREKPEAYPMVAEVAMQMGRRAAHNILADLRHQPLKPFRYRDLGSMSTIGRTDAVAYTFGIQLSGFVAWVSWLAVHLVFLIGFRNRLVTLAGWAWDYLTYNRGVRMIGGRRGETSDPARDWM